MKNDKYTQRLPLAYSDLLKATISSLHLKGHRRLYKISKSAIPWFIWLVRHLAKLSVNGCHRERIDGVSMESGGGVFYRDQEQGILNARRSATFQHQDW